MGELLTALKMDPEILTPLFLRENNSHVPLPCVFSLHVCLLGAREVPREGGAQHGGAGVPACPHTRVVTAGTPAHPPPLTATVTRLLGVCSCWVETRGHWVAFPRAGVWAGVGPIPGMLPRAPWLGAHPKSPCPGSCC